MIINLEMREVSQELIRQNSIALWIDDNLSRAFEFANQKEKHAFTCFDLVIEHHASILLLSKAQLFGTVFALMRVQYEALVNGLWLLVVATDADFERYKNGKVKPTLEDRVQLITKAKNLENENILSFHKQHNWKIFNGFTHSGAQATLRRMGEQTTGYDNYLEQDVLKSLRSSVQFVFVCAYELAVISKDNSLAKEVLALRKQYLDEIS